MRISFKDLKTADLYAGAIYEADLENLGSYNSEPLSNMFPHTGSSGGFRIRRGSNGLPINVMLVSTGKEDEWPDSFDPQSGIFTYFGDNREGDVSLLETSRKGNQTLSDVFALSHGDSALRALVPPFLAFKGTDEPRSLEFIGLAVPGTSFCNQGEDLVAFWTALKGKSFQNYRALFTILNEPFISGDWIRDNLNNQAINLTDKRVPKSYRKWQKIREFNPLIQN